MYTSYFYGSNTNTLLAGNNKGTTQNKRNPKQNSSFCSQLKVNNSSMWLSSCSPIRKKWGNNLPNTWSGIMLEHARPALVRVAAVMELSRLPEVSVPLKDIWLGTVLHHLSQPLPSACRPRCARSGMLHLSFSPPLECCHSLLFFGWSQTCSKH